MSEDDHECPECGRYSIPVVLNTDWRIGWFCYDCDLFEPVDGVKTSPSSTETDGGDER